MFSPILHKKILHQQNVRRSHPTLCRHYRQSSIFARTSTKWKSTLRASPLLCCIRSYKHLSWVKSGYHDGKYVKRTPTLRRIRIGLRKVNGLSTSSNRWSPFLATTKLSTNIMRRANNDLISPRISPKIHLKIIEPP